MPVIINYHKCNGCRICYDNCQFDVFTWDEEIDMPRATYDEECWHMCGICMMECPRRAIEVTMPIGNW